MSKNPYQLKRADSGNGAPANRLYKPLTNEEKLAKLVGYIPIPKDGWAQVPYNSHIRYVETEEKGGKFRNGGFVGSNSQTNKDGERIIKLKNSLFKGGKQYLEWIVKYSDIAYLYCKMNGVEHALRKDISSVATKLMQQIKKLEEEINRLKR